MEARIDVIKFLHEVVNSKYNIKNKIKEKGKNIIN